MELPRLIADKIYYYLWRKKYSIRFKCIHSWGLLINQEESRSGLNFEEVIWKWIKSLSKSLNNKYTFEHEVVDKIVDFQAKLYSGLIQMIQLKRSFIWHNMEASNLYVSNELHPDFVRKEGGNLEIVTTKVWLPITKWFISRRYEVWFSIVINCLG